jgi:hypothetical protein
MSLISAVTARGQIRFMIIGKGSVNTDVFIEFLKRLITGAEREIFLIVDRVARLIAQRKSALSCKRWAGNCACSFCCPIRRTGTPTSWCGSIAMGGKAARK